MKVTFELQRRSEVVAGHWSDWGVMEYAKLGDLSKKQIFPTVEEAKKARAAFIKRSAKYGWRFEFRIVRVTVTYEIID